MNSCCWKDITTRRSRGGQVAGRSRYYYLAGELRFGGRTGHVLPERPADRPTYEYFPPLATLTIIILWNGRGDDDDVESGETTVAIGSSNGAGHPYRYCCRLFYFYY